ncbi:hypothetical protein EV44_g5120 [Erysiphe necator]|uniref:Uncharacterized protein n=1 Tax=Uncinula necator TaxID=52586 RepID=A0A0B1P111_UNCNE|nr:hypothetical protein EV44_g5120 [Erysiphe necator]
MSYQNTSTTSTTPQLREAENRCRRSSRFLEGSEHASDQSATTNSHLISVLTEMDKYAQRTDLKNNPKTKNGKTSTNNASVESFNSNSTTGTYGTRPKANSTSKLAKRHINLLRASSSTGCYSNMGSDIHHKDLHEALNEVKKTIKVKLQNFKLTKSKKSNNHCTPSVL